MSEDLSNLAAGLYTEPESSIAIDCAHELVPTVGERGSGYILDVSVRSGTWTVPESHMWMRDQWDRRHHGERIDQKWGIRAVRGDRAGGRVSIEIQATTWREARACQDALAAPEHASLREGFVQSLLATGKALLPNIGVVHCIAETSDQKFVLGQRSAYVHYHPLRWSCSYEEGLAPEDVVVDQLPFERAAIRGAIEELIGSRPEEIGELVPLSVIVERDLVNPAVIMLVRLRVSFSELMDRAKSARDRIEFRDRSLRSVPVEPSALAELLTVGPSDSSELRERVQWHPTARYRIVTAMLYHFGKQRTLDAILAALGRTK